MSPPPKKSQWQASSFLWTILVFACVKGASDPSSLGNDGNTSFGFDPDLPTNSSGFPAGTLPALDELRRFGTIESSNDGFWERAQDTLYPPICDADASYGVGRADLTSPYWNGDRWSAQVLEAGRQGWQRVSDQLEQLKGRALGMNIVPVRARSKTLGNFYPPSSDTFRSRTRI